MGSIYDTIKILKRADAKATAKKEEWLKTQEYGISAKGVGEKGYIHHPDGTLTELCTLEAVEEGEGWGSATASFVNPDGKLERWTFTIKDMGSDEANDTKAEPEPSYPSAVFTVSGKLVYLIGVN
jgi:hypothetical protein